MAERGDFLPKERWYDFRTREDEERIIRLRAERRAAGADYLASMGRRALSGAAAETPTVAPIQISDTAAGTSSGPRRIEEPNFSTTTSWAQARPARLRLSGGSGWRSRSGLGADMGEVLLENEKAPPGRSGRGGSAWRCAGCGAR